MAGRLNRRKLLKLLGYNALGAGAGLAGLYHYASNIEVERLRLERATIPIDGLPSALEGFKIALLADFHLYPHTRLELIEEAVRLANSLKPDLTLLGGDYVLKTANSIFDLAPALARLDAVHGVFCILGNHDHWRGLDVVSQGLKSSGLPVLRNRGLTLKIGRRNLYLAGVDDGWAGRSDLAAALEGLPDGAPCIVLMHEPDFADPFSADPRISLQLSGHSHGGQVRFPLIGSPFLPPYGRKYDKGLYRVGGMPLFTTVGIGVTVPLRLNCPPEVAEITLTGTA